MKVAVVTPTIGSDELAECIRGVQNQTYSNLTHYLFYDGKEYWDKINNVVSSNSFGRREIKTIQLEENIGKGWYGHRVYAACSFLVNADIIMYLDQDNWFRPNHVETLVNAIKEKNLQWAYSLRNIHNKEGVFLCKDNAESLGKWPAWMNDKVYHIDTSCYAVRTDVAIRIGHAWYGQWGADRQFFHNLLTHFPNFDCTKQHTVCYRLDGNPNSVTEEFFIEGNKRMMEKYNGKLPWIL